MDRPPKKPPARLSREPLMGPIDEDEKTPVTTDPFVALEHRSKRTHENTTQALTTIQLVAEHVTNLDERMSRRANELERKLDQYIQLDKDEHQKLTDAQTKQAGALRTIHAQYKEIGGQVDKLSSNVGGNTKVLDLIHSDMQSIKRIEEHRQKVTITTDAIVRQTTVSDQADSNRVKRTINLELVKIIGAALGSGGIVTVVLLALLGKC